MNKQTALFGAGCFWGVEETFRRAKGVFETEVGYCGGHIANPNYEQVCSSKTNHAEVVRISFHADMITYTELLDIF